MDSVVDSKRRDRSGERGTVEDTEVLLRCERDRLDVVRRKRFAGRHDPASLERVRALEDADGRVADENARDVGQRRKVSGGGDTAAQRDKRDDVLAKEGVHALDELPAYTGVSADQGVHAHQDGTADPRLGHARRRERVEKWEGGGRRLRV